MSTTVIIIIAVVAVMLVYVVVEKLVTIAANKTEDAIRNARAAKKNQQTKDQSENLADRFK